MVNNERFGAVIEIRQPSAEGTLLDIDKMLADLRVEREQIEEAILTLERLARGRGRRRGRPPSWLKDISGATAEASSNGASAQPETKKPRASSKAKQAAAGEA